MPKYGGGLLTPVQDKQLFEPVQENARDFLNLGRRKAERTIPKQRRPVVICPRALKARFSMARPGRRTGAGV